METDRGTWTVTFKFIMIFIFKGNPYTSACISDFLEEVILVEIDYYFNPNK